MDSIAGLEAHRQALLNEMLQIRWVVRGTFEEQMLPVRHRDRKEPVWRGPYFVLARWTQGKTHSRRIPASEAPRMREGTQNYKRLKELCEQFAAVTERLGELERSSDASEEALKKGRKSRRSSPRR